MQIRALRGWIALLGGMLVCLAGCQDYVYEELPASVIKEQRQVYNITIASAVDILFVVDNSGSMVGEQRQLAESFETFSAALEEKFGEDYHIAVITTGMESWVCPVCSDAHPFGCMNETGENGRFQDRIGKIVGGTDDAPLWEHYRDESCRVVTPANKHCFYDPNQRQGIALVGTTGCGYERGLAPVRRALQPDLLGSWNSNFLRDNATLAVVVISDEEDCGEIGDISEGIQPDQADLCYYASKGIGPENTTSHPNDSDSKPYDLIDVQEYYDFLMGLKDNREGMVKFAAIVGASDPQNPASTTIEYEWDTDRERYRVSNACTTSGCTGQYCYAQPGTRYLELAQMFGLGEGEHGFIDTICQDDFTETMLKLSSIVACPERFLLSEKILDPGLAAILINGESIPQNTCSIEGALVPCSGPGGECSQGGECVETWTYTPPTDPPDPLAKGGYISFAKHYDPCDLFGEGDQVRIEVVAVVE